MKQYLSLVLLAACGDPPARPTDDAPPADIDAPIEPLSVAVTRGGAPVADVQVYFQADDSTLVASRRTDASGVARASGSTFVSVIVPPSTFTSTQIYTFTAVEPTDVLHVELDPSVRPFIGATIEFTESTNPDIAKYVMSLGCGGVADVIPNVTISGHCGGPGIDTVITDALLVGVDLADRPVEQIFLPGMILGQQAPVVITTPWSPSRTTTIAYSNLPDDVFTLEFEQDLWTATGRVWPGEYRIAMAEEHAVMTTEPVPDVAGAAYVMRTTTKSGSGAYRSIHDVRPYAATYDFQQSFADAMPRDLSALPSFDVGMHAIRWSEGATGVAANVAVGTVHVQRGNDSWDWHVAGDHASTKLRVPSLPVEGKDYNPQSGDTTTVDLEEADRAGGYAARRARVFDGLTDLDGATAPFTSLRYP